MHSPNNIGFVACNGDTPKARLLTETNALLVAARDRTMAAEESLMVDRKTRAANRRMRSESLSEQVLLHNFEFCTFVVRKKSQSLVLLTCTLPRKRVSLGSGKEPRLRGLVLGTTSSLELVLQTALGVCFYVAIAISRGTHGR